MMKRNQNSRTRWLSMAKLFVKKKTRHEHVFLGSQRLEKSTAGRVCLSLLRALRTSRGGFARQRVVNRMALLAFCSPIHRKPLCGTNNRAMAKNFIVFHQHCFETTQALSLNFLRDNFPCGNFLPELRNFVRGICVFCWINFLLISVKLSLTWL